MKRKRILWLIIPLALLVVFVALCALPTMEDRVSGIENYDPVTNPKKFD